ncbi:DUF3990 domain-containing protein [Paenibacillus caui]|uniref:DUF3990 domain-containing protein n=1 Tax=Paenibacillus caui TaxID=2873927 RepID=UPI001CA8DC8E|nr:DUF3990 domain-containing protein [Paenibacillus caui]
MPKSDILSRVFERIEKFMYHGTHTGNYNSLYNGINVKQSKRKLDFGTGFYLTSDFTQASKHAVKKAAPVNQEAIVFIYEVDTVRLRKEYNSYILQRMDLVWAEFIYDNRSPQFSKPHTYDYVYGGVADGQNLYDLLAQMDDDKMNTGEIDVEFFLESIAKYLYDQLSIHNQDIVNQGIIKLLRVVKAHDKRTEYIPA